LGGEKKRFLNINPSKMINGVFVVTGFRRIKQFVNEFIKGDETSLNELRRVVKEFFRGKTQKEIDKMDGKKVLAVAEAHDVLRKRTLTRVDKALLDLIFNEKPREHACLNVQVRVNAKEFKRVVKVVHEKELFDSESQKELMSFAGWVLVYDTWWGGVTLENAEKDLRVEINLSHWREKPELKLLVLGDKKHAGLIKKIKEILKVI